MAEPDQVSAWEAARQRRIEWEARQRPWDDFDPANDVSPSDYEDLEDDDDREDDDEEV